MRLFGGLSFPLFGRARAGVSKSGTPWIGVRTRGPAGTYAGALVSADGHRSHRMAPAPVMIFEVDDDGRIYLGGAEVDREDLRAVLAASDEALALRR